MAPLPVSPFPSIPSLRWQFPAEDPPGDGTGPFVVQRDFSLASDAALHLPSSASRPPIIKPQEGTLRATFAIQHAWTTEGAGAWHITLTTEPSPPARAQDPAHDEKAQPNPELALAARLWVTCYRASNVHARFHLSRVLGASIAFDGLVAHHFLLHHVVHEIDDLIQRALKAAAQEGDAWATQPQAQGRLLAEARGALDDLRAILLGDEPGFDPHAQEQEIPAWDARLAAWIEQLGAKGLANEVRDRGREAASIGGPAFWAKWLPNHTHPPLRRLTFALFALWRARVRPVLEREARSKPLRIDTVAYAGDRYTPVPKITAPVSWAFGAPGVPVKEVGGDHYAHEPSFIEDAALLPKSWKLLPADHAKRPHQTALPLDEGRGDALPVAIAGSQGYVLSPYAAKLALLMLASRQVRSGEMARSTLGELTRMTRPDTKRLQQRDHEATARGLDELRQLFLFLPNLAKVQVFDVTSTWAPSKASPDLPVLYGLAASFRMTLEQAHEGQLHGPGLGGQEYRGSFLLNLTGAMRLPNNQPTLLRYYMRFAAHWNAAFALGSSGEFDPERMPARTAEEWAALANALPPGVVEYLLAKGDERRALAGRRFALRDERKRVQADLRALADEHGLIKLDIQGDQIKPLPPPAWIEAWQLFRTGVSRPADPTDEG